MIKINKLRAKVVERGLTIGQVAHHLGIDRSTLYRKMRDNSGRRFSVLEVQQLSAILRLSPSEIQDIFYDGDVA